MDLFYFFRIGLGYNIPPMYSSTGTQINYVISLAYSFFVMFNNY